MKPSQSDGPLDGAAERFASPVFVIRKQALAVNKRKLIVEDYEGDQALVVVREDEGLLRFYGDSSLDRELLTLQRATPAEAEGLPRRDDPDGLHRVDDPVLGETVGYVVLRRGTVLGRQEWRLLDGERRAVGWVADRSSGWLVLLRRVSAIALTVMSFLTFWVLSPFLAAVRNAAFSPRLRVEVDGHLVSVIEQRMDLSLKRRVEADFTSDSVGRLDPRLGVAAATLIAAMQLRR